MTGTLLFPFVSSSSLVLAHHSPSKLDYAEERASELEVLESIFPDELQGKLLISLLEDTKVGGNGK